MVTGAKGPPVRLMYTLGGDNFVDNPSLQLLALQLLASGLLASLPALHATLAGPSLRPWQTRQAGHNKDARAAGWGAGTSSAKRPD